MPRKLVYYVACTLDGFIARQDGSFQGFLTEGDHFPDLFKRFPETFPVHLRRLLGITGEPRRFDTVLMGRGTYVVGLREGITSPYDPLRQYLISGTLPQSPDPAVELVRSDPVDLVRRLKAQDGMDIWLCGGSKLAAGLLPEIDELILKINPILIGTGIPLFDGFDGLRHATLLDHKTYPNGFVLARYRLDPENW